MKITTLIPAYKPKYLVELLTAIRNQTVKPDKIIISDDSPDEAFLKAMSSSPIKNAVADLNIQTLRGPCQGAEVNFHFLLNIFQQQASTELFHLQFDDDIPYPSFYDKHINVHRTHDIRCSVSRRWTASDFGQPIRDLPVPTAIDQSAHHLISLNSKMLFEHTAGLSSNWLGEFSNAVFHSSMAPELDDTRLAGISFGGLEDIGGFLKASLHRPIAYINDHLGFFRISAEHRSADPMGRALKMAHLAYIALALAGRDLKQLSPIQCSNVLRNLCPIIEARYGLEADMRNICGLMPALGRGDDGAETRFLQEWNIYSTNVESQ